MSVFNRGTNIIIQADPGIYIREGIAAAAAAAASADAAANSAESAATDNFRTLRDVATLLANTSIVYGAGAAQVAAGDIMQTRAEGFSYEVAAEAATDQHVTTAGGVKLYVLEGEAGYNVKAFGADSTAASYSNAAVRKAFAAVEAGGGGVVYFPAGSYSFFREIDPNQPPATGTFNQRACFVAGDGTTIKGDGRDATVLTFECPGQSAGSVDDTQFYQFIAHGRGFELTDITVQGDVEEADFEFVPFWGSVNIPSIIVHASRDGNIYGKNSRVHNCRLGGLRGMCYGTSIILGVEFVNNDVFLSNGMNASGENIRCNYNNWYRSEIIESAGAGIGNADAVAAGFSERANIEFNYNTCVDCSGGALGGNISTSALERTKGYSLIGNRIFCTGFDTAAAISIANNAYDTVIAENIIIGRYTNAALNISNSGLVGRSPGNVHIVSGYYETVGATTGVGRKAVNIGLSENEVTIHGGTFKSDSAFAILLGGDAPAKVNLLGGNFVGQYAYSFATGTTIGLNVSKKISWTPTTTGNLNQLSSNMTSISTDVVKPTIERFLTVSEVDANQIIEAFKRNGGALTDDRFAHFLRYATGRMGWGDPTTVSVFPDVYLERKAAHTLGLDVGDAFRTGATTTAARPSASVVGAGAMMWDTTLGRPIWSNGSAWVGADGAAV
jgi:hypothetical protein